jgi:hypothetical protein
MDQSVRKDPSGNRADLSWLHRGYRTEIRRYIQVHQLPVGFAEGSHVLIAQPSVECQVLAHAPVVLHIKADGVGAEVVIVRP